MASRPFRLAAPYAPAGDQPEAISALSEGVAAGTRHQTLLGVTGSGKTMTMASVIQASGKPALILSHNKTLAAQLYGEMRSFFPDNAVEYFISYYDYYQPEAYLPASDTYIAKDASINKDIERLRLRTTASLMARSDVIVVSTVSAIYGLGDPSVYRSRMLLMSVGESRSRDALLRSLVDLQYGRNDASPEPGSFRARGDVVDIFPAYDTSFIRVEMFGDTVERVSRLEAVSAAFIEELPSVAIYPARHFLASPATIERATRDILAEASMQSEIFTQQGLLLEARRILARSTHDVEMLRETGTCQGIENYSRIFSGRPPGERPACLLDYFPPEYLAFLDESHVTLPQIGGMYAGDRSRKETLVRYGFRLPSAMDNRPLRMEEFMDIVPQAIFVSATPADTELALSGGRVVEQVVRPTAIVDPEVFVRPVATQVDDLLEEIRQAVIGSYRVLVTTLTKRSAEDLSDYLTEAGVRSRYLHSDIASLERMEILRDLRLGEFDVLIGINLLREGLDLPEVALVAILDADQEGFLRSDRSLIQTAGRAARHSGGRVIMYADRMTGSMNRAIQEMSRRRSRQIEYNREHGLSPVSATKTRDQIMRQTTLATHSAPRAAAVVLSKAGVKEQIAELEKEMRAAASSMDFERAALLRDAVLEIKASI